MYNQNLNDAQLASLSVLSYSRWRPIWRRCIKTFVLLQVFVRFYIVNVIHVFRCFKSQQIHLGRFQSIQSSFNASKVNINAIMSKIATAVKPNIKNAYILANLNNYCICIVIAIVQKLLWWINTVCSHNRIS